MAVTNIGTAKRPDEDNPGLARERMYQIMIEIIGEDKLATWMGSNQNTSVFPIIANLPERFHVELSSQWNTPFSQASAGSVADAVTGSALLGQTVDMALSAAGVGTKVKSQFVKLWESTSGLQMNFDLVFYAHQNTEREIRDRHLALMKLCAPSAANGQVMIAPGPKLLDKSGVIGGRQINVYIGNYMTIRNAIIDSVGSDIVSLFDDNGIPIGMSINLAISTWDDCVTVEQLDEIFGQGGG